MKRRPFAIAFLIVALVLGGGVLWRFSYENAGWQIRRVFPGAQPYFDPLNSPDPSFPQFIRYFVPGYLATDEPLGFSLADCQEPLDLHERFSRLSHLKVISIHLTRCRITHLCSTSERGFPSMIEFDDCDFSQLPPEQRSQLPANHASAKKFFIGDI